MSDDTPHDPWDTLADSLGAKPSGNPPPAPKPVPPPQPRRERPAARQPAPPPAAGDWDSLAAELGVQPKREESSGRAAAPRPVEPRVPVEPPAPRERGPEPRRERRSSHDEAIPQEAPPARREPAEGERRERPARAAGDDSEGATEGSARRRRRGRRGGRGRRRGDDRGPTGEATAGGERQPSGRDGDRARRGAGRLPRPADDASEGDAWRDDLEADFDEGLPAAESREAAEADHERRGPAADRPAGDDDRPRKRRRRGRRGGRGRDRGDEAGPRGDRGPRPSAPGEDGDDEPLPASYGSRPVEQRDDERETRSDAEAPAARKSDADDAPRGRSRRRRSRRGGERRREPSGERAPRPAGRSERRRDESRPSRGRRGDFEPVAGRYDEDDEGLEFLGVEEAARTASPRPRPAAEDDVLAESGLTGVLDVPSWVEAIGIVIAGNLAARSRSGRGDGGKGR